MQKCRKTLTSEAKRNRLDLMKMIVGVIDPRFTEVVSAMCMSDGIVLPKTVAAAKKKPLVVLELRKVVINRCR